MDKEELLHGSAFSFIYGFCSVLVLLVVVLQFGHDVSLVFTGNYMGRILHASSWLALLEFGSAMAVTAIVCQFYRGGFGIYRYSKK